MPRWRCRVVRHTRCPSRPPIWDRRVWEERSRADRLRRRGSSLKLGLGVFFATCTDPSSLTSNPSWQPRLAQPSRGGMTRPFRLQLSPASRELPRRCDLPARTLPHRSQSPSATARAVHSRSANQSITIRSRAKIPTWFYLPPKMSTSGTGRLRWLDPSYATLPPPRLHLR